VNLKPSDDPGFGAATIGLAHLALGSYTSAPTLTNSLTFSGMKATCGCEYLRCVALTGLASALILITIGAILAGESGPILTLKTSSYLFIMALILSRPLVLIPTSFVFTTMVAHAFLKSAMSTSAMSLPAKPNGFTVVM
jgi:hypothetical protein